MSDITDQLEEERRIINAATAGPWRYFTPNPRNNPGFNVVVSVALENDPLTRSSDIAEGLSQSDAELFAHARTALPLRSAQVEAVYAIHTQGPPVNGRTICVHCYDAYYPCATIRAIEEAGA
jgi:hypothetical protein